MRPIASFIVGFCLAALALEAVLRCLPVSTGYAMGGVDEHNPIMRGEPHFHYVYSKNWNLRLANSGSLNNFGFRASQDYVPNARAVLVVGNSFVSADAIEPGQNMTESLGRLLGRPAYALGADGSSLADYVAAAQWGAATFWSASATHSSIALVLLTTGDLDRTCLPRAGGHYLRFDGAGISDELWPKANPSRSKRLLNQSMLFRYLLDNLHAAGNWRLFNGSGQETPGTPPPAAATAHRRVSCASPEYLQHATDYLLDSFRHFQEQHQATVVFAVAPGYRAEQNYASWAMRDIDVFAQRARAAGFGVVSFDQEFASALRTGNRLDFDPIDGHWNKRANAIAAHAVADFIKSAESMATIPSPAGTSSINGRRSTH